MMKNLLSNIYRSIPLVQAIPIRNFTTLLISSPHITNNFAGGNWTLTQIRNKVRNNWPRPSEVKRVTAHGWKKRMSTLHGRKIIMRRILAGRYVLSH